jgi:SNF2 family DNA or RNA helicase
MITLRKYQKEGYQKLKKFKGRALIADEMRLGKTAQALWFLKHYPKALPAIIVCPAIVKWELQEQAKKHVGLKSLVIEGTKPRPLINPPPIIIINYELLEKNKSKSSKAPVKPTDSWWYHLLKLKPQTIITDECQKIKNPRAKRTRAVKKLTKGIPHIIGISGTPFTRKPIEFFPILNIIRPDLFPSFLSYAYRYCKPKVTPWGIQYDGATHLKELNHLLRKNLMIRRLRKQVWRQLPDKIRTIIPLEIKRRKEYEQASENLIAWLVKKRFTRRAVRASKALALVKIGYLKRLAAELKYDQICLWIDDFLEKTNEKIVIYGIHKSVLRPLYEKYKNISVIVDGEVSGRKKNDAKIKFQKEKKCRIFFGNITSASVGIPLGKASAVAFIELDFVPSNHTQAEDRIIHFDKKDAPISYYLIAKGTVEETICRLIQKRQEVLSSILDGKKKINSLDIYDSLEKILKKQYDNNNYE